MLTCHQFSSVSTIQRGRRTCSPNDQIVREEGGQSILGVARISVITNWTLSIARELLVGKKLRSTVPAHPNVLQPKLPNAYISDRKRWN